MPRKKTKSLQRKIMPDRKYNSVLVQRLINKVMVAGKKSTAERLVYSGMEQAANTLKEADPLVALENGMKNIYPAMEVKSRRVGGANYQIPFEVKGTRKTHLALMWFVAAVRARKGKSLDKCIADEIVDANNSTGTAVKVKEDTHRMAEANRAFAHFARY